MKYIFLLIGILVSYASFAQQACSGGTVNLDVGAGYNSVLWSNGATSESIAVTNAGTYTVTVTDSNGCTSDLSQDVTFCSPLLASVSSNDNTSCSAPFNGQATVNASGGCSGGYSYNWSTIPAQTTATATNLSVGTYSVTVSTTSDLNCNCDVVQTVTIGDSSTGITASINLSCN